MNSYNNLQSLYPLQTFGQALWSLSDDEPQFKQLTDHSLPWQHRDDQRMSYHSVEPCFFTNIGACGRTKVVLLPISHYRSV